MRLAAAGTSLVLEPSPPAPLLDPSTVPDLVEQLRVDDEGDAGGHRGRHAPERTRHDGGGAPGQHLGHRRERHHPRAAAEGADVDRAPHEQDRAQPDGIEALGHDLERLAAPVAAEVPSVTSTGGAPSSRCRRSRVVDHLTGRTFPDRETSPAERRPVVGVSPVVVRRCEDHGAVGAQPREAGVAPDRRLTEALSRVVLTLASPMARPRDVPQVAHDQRLSGPGSRNERAPRGGDPLGGRDHHREELARHDRDPHRRATGGDADAKSGGSPARRRPDRPSASEPTAASASSVEALIQ